jgi:alkaline phosphatase D
VGGIRAAHIVAASMITRRQLLRAVGASAGFAAAPGLVHAVAALPKWRSFPFTLGVASGALTSEGFVIWTRLAPDPLSTDPTLVGGLSGGDVSVRFEIAEDEAMRQVVQTGTALAEARYAFSVHHLVRGLKPGRPYWYRFVSGDATSRIGRAMTLPAAGAPLEKLRVGYVSCSNYETGYFAAYRHLAAELPDVVLCLGDYIYEYVDKVATNLVRHHSDGVEPIDLQGYRNRYAQYRLDEDLQRLHATAPALVTWDDHEVHNDYADLLSQTFLDPAEFARRRAAAYSAFYEHMPVTPARPPDGPFLRIHDRFTFGNLVEISMADARQYRSRPACYGPPDRKPGRIVTTHECPELFSQQRSMLGTAQETWLQDGLARSQARWNIVAQSLMMARMRRRNSEGEAIFWTDDWNGYPASRARLLRHLHEARVANPLVVGGDIHSFWANDLKLDFDDPDSPTVATEFVGSSISANGPSFDFAKALPENPHVRFFDKSVRGYVCADIQAAQTTVRFQAISDQRDPKATVRTLRAFAVENGRAGVQDVS